MQDAQQAVDEPDSGERRDDAADAINEQIPAEQAAALMGRYFTPRRASGIKATMISALKITAASTALCGVCSS